MSSLTAPATDAVPTPVGSNAGAGSMAWNQPGFAALWGLATAKDSLKYWLQTKSFRCFGLTRWVFTIFFVMNALNGFVVMNRIIFAGVVTEFASYPLATAIVLLLVLSSTKERSQGTYFWMMWSCWIFIVLVGFVNAAHLTSEDYRSVAQNVIKSWITLIGFPWMAFRVISPEKLPQYTKLLVYTATIGSLMCLVQIANPALFSYIRSGATLRGAGVWDNANGAGMVLMLSLFLTRFVNWPSRWLKWTVYLILLAGFVGTFSRAAILAFIAGEMVYLLIVRNYKRIFLGLFFMLIFLSTWITIGLLVHNDTIHVESREMRDRLQTFSNFVTGKAGEELESNRTTLWRSTIQDVINKGNVLFGLGHIGLDRMASKRLTAHSEYVRFFADGGVFGLTALLVLLATFVYIFWRCKDRAIRASLMSMIVGYSVFCLFGDGALYLQMTGPFFAIFVMWAHYTRFYPGAEKVQRLKRSLTHSVAMANQPVPSPS